MMVAAALWLDGNSATIRNKGPGVRALAAAKLTISVLADQAASVLSA